MPEKRQSLNRFAQAHFICEDSSELICAKELKPCDTLFLIRTQNRFQAPERRTSQAHFTALASSSLAPGCWRLYGPFTMLSQTGFQKSGLLITNAVTLTVLLRTAFSQ